MARATKAPIDPDDAPLKRLGGGRWQTRDERFTIEPQSGTWVVVDGEQTDDFGMPLVRGPFPSLTAAKEAITGARSSAPAESPLTERIERRRGAPAAEPAQGKAAKGGRRAREGAADGDDQAVRGASRRPARSADRTSAGDSGHAKARQADESPSEPGWLTDLEPAERGRARRLITRLVDDGIPDAEGLVRRDIVGDVAALAAAAIGRRLAELGADARPDDVAELLADGRDERLDVRWRLVDGEGRPILLDPGRRRRR